MNDALGIGALFYVFETIEKKWQVKINHDIIPNNNFSIYRLWSQLFLMTSTSFLTFLELIIRFQCLQQRPTSITVNAHIIAQEIGEEWRNTTIFVWYATLLSTLQIIPLVYFAVTNSSMSVVSSIATMESKHPSLFFTFYTKVLITFPWVLNISKVFKIYSFYLTRNKGIYYYFYYFRLMRLIFPAWRLKLNNKSTSEVPRPMRPVLQITGRWSRHR